MNIKVQCCGLVLLFVLGIIYSRKKTIRLSISRVFMRFFSVTRLTRGIRQNGNAIGGKPHTFKRVTHYPSEAEV